MRALGPCRLGLVCASSLSVLGVAACGGGSSSHPATNRVTAASTPTVTAPPAPPAPAPRLRILAPRAGARISETLAARVSLAGATVDGVRALRYVLDGTFTRFGATKVTFHDLAPGRHHLAVALVSRPSVRAIVIFTVAAPVVAPAQVPATTPAAPAPATQAPAPSSAPASPPAAAPAPAPMSSSGIPQGPNAGDADGDNHGGPSDGDGNI